MHTFLRIALLTGIVLLTGAMARGQKPAAALTAKATASDAQDVVLLLPNRPALVRIHVKVDGKPVQQSWNDFFTHLFGLLDVEKDGKLDAEERAKIPAPNTLFNTANLYYSNLRVNGGLGGTSTPVNLKAVKEPFDIVGLIDYYRRSGVMPLRVAGSNTQMAINGLSSYYTPYPGMASPSAEKVTAAFLSMLDGNGDGKLSVAELRSAEPSLLERDFNEDEILTIQESIGNLSSSASPYQLRVSTLSYARPSYVSQSHLVFLVAGREPSQSLATVLLKKYGSKNATALAPGDVGLSKETFRRLDKNDDGKLDAKELARFADRKPDVAMSFDVGAKPAVAKIKSQPASSSGATPPPALGIKIQKQLQVDLEFAQIRFSVGAVGQSSNVQYLFNASYQQQVFTSIDRDKNGYLDDKEANRNPSYRSSFKLIDADNDGKLFLKEIQAYYKKWQSLYTRAQSATVSLSLFEEGNGFFGLLDANGDARLSVREMRGAPALLAKLDRDKDGSLERGEIPLHYHVSLSKGASQNAQLWDVQGSIVGYVSPRQPKINSSGNTGPLWFRKMDRNNDGDVSEREFLGDKETFDKLDSDGDRLLSAKEAQAFETQSRNREKKRP